jgi:hypothetical protein
MNDILVKGLREIIRRCEAIVRNVLIFPEFVQYRLKFHRKIIIFWAFFSSLCLQYEEYVKFAWTR